MAQLVKKIDFESKLNDLMEERNRSWAANLSLQEILNDDGM